MHSRRNILFAILLFSCHETTQLSPITCVSGNSCGSGIGACTYGSIFCDDDGGSTCVGAVDPSLETCDGIDNDCDGLVDNNLPDLGSCSAECTPGGIMVCSRGRPTCIPIQNPHPETCNGKDDDCDGVTDNVIWDGGIYCYTGPPDTAGNGSCHPGVWKCIDNYRQDCVGQVLPSPEICNSIDDDCDGMIDDGLSCVGQAKDLHVELSWNAVNDVDLHLRNNDRASGTITSRVGWSAAPFDCFYGNPTPVWEPPDGGGNPRLAFDDLFGPGPEHIRMNQMEDGDAGYGIGVHVFDWKSNPVEVSARVKIYCGGVLIATRDHQLRDRQFWYVGSIRRTLADPCLFEDAPDGGVVF